MEKRKVYLIDDEEELLETYKTALANQYELYTFNSPLLVIQAVEEGKVPDAFVTDIRMPQMDGIQLIEWARARQIEKPFVIVSGYSAKSHAMRALKLGTVDMIEKPFPAELFRNVVKRAVVHSVYQQLQHDLLTKYQVLTQSLIDLAKNYEARFLAAEDELFKLNRLSTMGQDKVTQLLKSTKESVSLEKVVGASQDNIRQLLLLVEEVKTIMQSTV